MKPISERFIFDDKKDEFTFDGIHFDAIAFESFFQPFAKGKWIRIDSVENGIVTVTTKVES